ncbi:MAG TPA: hypothetical protein VH639_18985 [Bryobacteraceae bacterium]|jgi:hypothetical protein
MARAKILGALIGAGLFTAGAQTAARPPRSIFGTYGQSSRGRDSIRVAGKAGGKISVAIRLYFANGHRCNLSADGDWRDDHVAIVAEGLTPARPCRLNVFFDKGRALLKDEGLQCAPVYCGTRGELDNVSLSKSKAGR